MKAPYARLLALLGLSLAACSAPTPATPAPAPAGSAAARAAPPAAGHVPAGDATSAVLAIVRETRGRKVRIVNEMTVGDRTRRMTLELVPPDRRHMRMDPGGSSPIQVEMIQIGDHGWRRMGPTDPWQPIAQNAVAVGAAAANDGLDEMMRKLESGETLVERDPDSGGMSVFHVTDAHAGPGGMRYDGRLYVGSNGLPDHVDGERTGGATVGSRVLQRFEFDDSLQIEPPIAN